MLQGLAYEQYMPLRLQSHQTETTHFLLDRYLWPVKAGAKNVLALLISTVRLCSLGRIRVKDLQWAAMGTSGHFN